MVAEKSQISARERILIAEDSRTQVEQLRALLEDAGYKVDAAFNGRLALEAALANPPHLVISDVNMPEMDGYEFCRAFKADQRLRDVPFMLVTSLSAPSDVVHGLECGADNFITKPYEEITLLDRVRYLLTNSALRGASRVRSGVEIDLGGKVHFITAQRQQILDLLISTYAEAVRLSDEAIKRGEKLRESHEIMAVLQQSAEGLNKVHTEKEVMAEALARVRELPFCRASWILLTDDDGMIARVSESGLTDAEAAGLSSRTICACQRDAHLGKLGSVAQIETCSRLPAGSEAAPTAHACVPLVGQQRNFGVLNALPREDSPFLPEELRILSGLGSQVSAALDRAHLNANLERKVEARTQELRREISVRHSAESAAIAATARLERAQRIAHVGSAEANLATGQDFWSDEFYRLLGLEPGSVPPSPEHVRAAVHPDDRAIWAEAHNRTRSGGRIEPVELRIVRPDGEVRWLFRHGELVTDANGNATTIAVSYQDITERRRAEEDLRHSREHLARMQAITRIGSTEVNLRTGEAFWSDEVYNLLGVERGDTSPGVDSFAERIHPDDAPKMREVSLRGRQGEATEPIEFRVVMPDGSVKWFVRQSDFISGTDGKPEILLATMFDVTRIRRAEDALRASEALTRALIDAVPDYLWFKDVESRFVVANKAVAAGRGMQPAELLGTTDFDWFPREKAQGFRDDELRVMRTHEPIIDQEEQFNTPNGKRWQSSTKVPVVNEAGEVIGVVGAARDISDRKAMEEELRQSREHLSLAQRVGGIGSAEVDILTGTETWSDQHCRIFGLNPDEAPRGLEQFLAFVHPDDRKVVNDANERVYRGEEVGPIEIRIKRADGAERVIVAQRQIVRNEAGQPVKQLITNQDVTERKEAQEALRSSQEHLSLAQRVGNIGSCAVDLRSGDAYWSDELYRMYGLDRGAPTTPEFFYSLVHPDDRAGLEAANRATLEGNSADRFEFRLTRPDGQMRRFVREARVIRDGSGQPVTLLMTNQDITESRSLEEQLRQSQKMEAVGNLTGGIAHDFNNILAVVIGNLDLLKMEVTGGSEADTLVDTAIGACLKGSELTKSLLAFSRRQPLQPKRTNINKLLQDSTKMLSRAIGENVKVQTKFGDDLWDVLVDPSLLESALLNMMVNSRDAMPNGGHIIIGSRNTSLDEAYAAQNAEVIPGDYVALEVSDTGTGMPPEVLQRVFEPFFTTKEKGKGTGLGLAMVFGFVKQSGGHIKIYSEVGHGTTIRIYLPRIAAPEEAVSAVKAKEQAPASVRNEMILIVEDNPAVRRAVCKQLKGAGYRIAEAESAVHAVEVLEGGLNADLIFSDVIMPGGMTGAELAREAGKRWPKSKVLLTSGFPEGLLENGNKLPSGVNLLSKPYRMEDLLRKVREVIDG